MRTDLYLVGLGIGGAHRMTCEARDILEFAKEVLHLSAIDEDLRNLCRGTVTSLLPVYTDQDDASRVYAALTDNIMASAERAKAAGGYAAYAMYGHPLLIEESSRQAMRECERRQLSCAVVPGLSCFDVLLVDSPTPLDNGAQLYDARQFVTYNLEVEARVPLVLLELGDLESEDKLRPNHLDVGRFRGLHEKLSALYPAEHEVYIVFSAYKAGVASRVHATTIARLATSWELAHTGTTMIVPAVTRRVSS